MMYVSVCCVNMLQLDFVCLSILVYLFFFKQKTAYELRISDLSSDVCSSDLDAALRGARGYRNPRGRGCLGADRLHLPARIDAGRAGSDRKSVVEGKSVSVRVDIGGSSIIKKQRKMHCQSSIQTIRCNTSL